MAILRLSVGLSRLLHAIASRDRRSREQVKEGDIVRIKHSVRSPLSGWLGRVIEISVNDPCGPYLVAFNDALKFRYRAVELENLRLERASAKMPSSLARVD
jgi:hypothetical protein